MTRSHRIWSAGSVLAAAVVAASYVRAGAQVVTPLPEKLRFQALLSEPIAEPGRQGVVAGTSVMLVKDRLTNECFVAVTIGDAMGLSPAACPP